jgi:hypothetical protein
MMPKPSTSIKMVTKIKPSAADVLVFGFIFIRKNTRHLKY